MLACRVAAVFNKSTKNDVLCRCCRQYSGYLFDDSAEWGRLPAFFLDIYKTGALVTGNESVSNADGKRQDESRSIGMFLTVARDICSLYMKS